MVVVYNRFSREKPAHYRSICVRCGKVEFGPALHTYCFDCKEKIRTGAIDGDGQQVSDCE